MLETLLGTLMMILVNIGVVDSPALGATQCQAMSGDPVPTPCPPAGDDAEEDSLIKGGGSGLIKAGGAG